MEIRKMKVGPGKAAHNAAVACANFAIAHWRLAISEAERHFDPKVGEAYAARFRANLEKAEAQRAGLTRA